MNFNKNWLWLIIPLLVLWGYSIFANWQYEQKIGSYMDNAYDMNTPSRMLEQLQNAKLGMVNEGLSPEMYGAIIFKKPSNRMDFQYQHIDSIKERVEAVQTWYQETYLSDNQLTETLGDVYEQKMTNLRQFIMEDVRSDWIAKNTWFIHHHPIIYIINFGSMGDTQKSDSGNTNLIILIGAIFGVYYYFKKRKGLPPLKLREDIR